MCDRKSSGYDTTHRMRIFPTNLLLLLTLLHVLLKRRGSRDRLAGIFILLRIGVTGVSHTTSSDGHKGGKKDHFGLLQHEVRVGEQSYIEFIRQANDRGNRQSKSIDFVLSIPTEYTFLTASLLQVLYVAGGVLTGAILTSIGGIDKKIRTVSTRVRRRTEKIDLTRTNATHVRNSPVRKRNSVDFVTNVMRDQTLKSITC